MGGPPRPPPPPPNPPPATGGRPGGAARTGSDKEVKIMTKNPLPHVVIVGGGFGGLAAASALRNAPVRVTLIDRSNHHLFQPLLYQVATATLAAGDSGAPIGHLLRKQRN